MLSVPCPICDRIMEGQSVAEWPYFPFCGKRCKTIDLGRWLAASYGIRAEEPEDQDDISAADIP
jgi:uncharacterized protein